MAPLAGVGPEVPPLTLQERAAQRAASPRPAIGKKRFWDGALFEWLVIYPVELFASRLFAPLMYYPDILDALRRRPNRPRRRKDPPATGPR
jgi:hypothetical protein